MIRLFDGNTLTGKQLLYYGQCPYCESAIHWKISQGYSGGLEGGCKCNRGWVADINEVRIRVGCDPDHWREWKAKQDELDAANDLPPSQ
jgi:hypothetical protein